MKKRAIGRILFFVTTFCMAMGLTVTQAHAMNQVSTAQCERDGGFVMKNSAGKWCKLGHFDGWGIYDVKGGGGHPRPGFEAGAGPKTKSPASGGQDGIDSARHK